ncbi:HPP family protein [Methylovirgula sp. 4M-Z18]|nr:HPP family protein [Methylovirgula sp. 4M-Z18]
MPLKLFKPILPGTRLRDRAIACVGALLGIGLTGLSCSLLAGRDPHLPLIVAPIGASSVLLFAVPASPLAQPWSIIGGNTISALAGILVAQFVHDPMWAIGCGVALAIAAMSLTRCLHPPGGAAALTAIIGGPQVLGAGFLFALVPVAFNSIVLVLLGWLFHRFSGHSYPHVPKPRAPQPVNFLPQDIDAALDDLGEAFDIDREDLDRLLRQVEIHATLRQQEASTIYQI